MIILYCNSNILYLFPVYKQREKKRERVERLTDIDNSMVIAQEK